MGKIALAYPDFSLSTKYPAGMSGGSWVSTLPLNNLLSPLRQKMTRSSDVLVTSTKLIMDLGISRNTQFVALLNSNVSANGTIRFRFYTDAGLTNLVYDTGAVNVWQAPYPTDEELNDYRPDFYRVLPSPQSARYCLVEIADTLNPDGYVEFGRLMFCPIWQPDTNIDYGCQVGWNDPYTEKEVSLGGVAWYNQKSLVRAAIVTLSNLSDAEAFTTVMEMVRRLGLSGQVYFIFDTDDTDWYLRQRSFLATMDKLSPLQIPNFGRNSAGFQFTEVL
jgi:hypothetical protein